MLHSRLSLDLPAFLVVRESAAGGGLKVIFNLKLKKKDTRYKLTAPVSCPGGPGGPAGPFGSVCKKQFCTSRDAREPV